jgi:DNA-binding CsgD family transcriptional regulator
VNDDNVGLEKIANLLALYLTKDMTKSNATSTLASAGFNTKEIATLIGTTEGSVRALISQSKKKLEK